MKKPTILITKKNGIIFIACAVLAVSLVLGLTLLVHNPTVSAQGQQSTTTTSASQNMNTQASTTTSSQPTTTLNTSTTTTTVNTSVNNQCQLNQP